MKKTNKKTGWPARILLSSIAALIILFYLMAAPLHNSVAQTTPSSLTIENSGSSPLKIVSASVAAISIPTNRTSDVTAHLIKPKIVLKNNSDSVVSVYVLEFRKAGSMPFYLTRTDVGLAPKGTDSIETNSPNTFLYSAGEAKATVTGDTWTVRLDVVRFKDGSVLTLHPSPIPSPPTVVPVKRVPGGVIGGVVPQKDPVPPPPLPPVPATPPPVPKPIVLNGSNIQQAKVIRRVEPVYPELANRARVQGKVVMEVTIDEEGNVTEAKALHGHPLLNDAAIAAVKQWKYSPALMNGEPISRWTVSVTLDFKLK